MGHVETGQEGKGLRCGVWTGGEWLKTCSKPFYLSWTGLGFMAVVDFATSDFETCPKYQNWANFINKSTTES